MYASVILFVAAVIISIIVAIYMVGFFLTAFMWVLEFINKIIRSNK